MDTRTRARGQLAGPLQRPGARRPHQPPRRPARAPSRRRPSPGATAPGRRSPRPGRRRPDSGSNPTRSRPPTTGARADRFRPPAASSRARCPDGAAPSRATAGRSALARIHSARGPVGAARQRAALRRARARSRARPDAVGAGSAFPAPGASAGRAAALALGAAVRTPHRLRGPHPRRLPAAAATGRPGGPEPSDLSEVSSSFHRAFGRGFFRPSRPAASARAPGCPG